MNLSPDLLNEYNKIKRELGAKTSKIEAECTALQAAADADAEALRMMQDSTAAVDERIKELGEYKYKVLTIQFLIILGFRRL